MLSAGYQYSFPTHENGSYNYIPMREYLGFPWAEIKEGKRMGILEVLEALGKGLKVEFLAESPIAPSRWFPIEDNISAARIWRFFNVDGGKTKFRIVNNISRLIKEEKTMQVMKIEEVLEALGKGLEVEIFLASYGRDGVWVDCRPDLPARSLWDHFTNKDAKYRLKKKKVKKYQVLYRDLMLISQGEIKLSEYKYTSISEFTLKNPSTKAIRLVQETEEEFEV